MFNYRHVGINLYAESVTRLDQLLLPNFAQTICIACPPTPTDSLADIPQKLASETWHIPLERQMTWTVLFSSGFVSARRVGAKNMASSSGCAIRSAIRWFRNVVVRAEEMVYILWND